MSWPARSARPKGVPERRELGDERLVFADVAPGTAT
jgi:hypothetical protein